MSIIDAALDHEPGYYTRGDTSEDALILEVRWALAARYGFVGLSNMCFDAFRPPEGPYYTRTVAEALQYFDMYAAQRGL